MPAWPPIRRFGLSRVMTSTTCPVSSGKSVSTKNLSSPRAKNISLSPSGKSALPARAVPPGKRGGRDRHERGMGCGGRGSVGAQVCSQGGFRERATARRTNGAGCVRQNRVVPTPVAGAKLRGGEVIQPDRSAIKPAATVTRRIRRRGEHGISRKAIAQGMPECFR